MQSQRTTEFSAQTSASLGERSDSPIEPQFLARIQGAQTEDATRIADLNSIKSSFDQALRIRKKIIARKLELLNIMLNDYLVCVYSEVPLNQNRKAELGKVLKNYHDLHNRELHVLEIFERGTIRGIVYLNRLNREYKGVLGTGFFATRKSELPDEVLKDLSLLIRIFRRIQRRLRAYERRTRKEEQIVYLYEFFLENELGNLKNINEQALKIRKKIEREVAADLILVNDLNLDIESLQDIQKQFGLQIDKVKGRHPLITRSLTTATGAVIAAGSVQLGLQAITFSRISFFISLIALFIYTFTSIKLQEKDRIDELSLLVHSGAIKRK